MMNRLKMIAVVAFLLVAGTSLLIWLELVDFQRASSPSKTTKIARKVPPKFQTPVLTNCLSADLANGAVIAALGAYEGRADPSAATNADNHKIGRVNLTAAQSGPPMILIVSAYNPVIWDFSKVPSNRVRAVLAMGYYDQVVKGLPHSVPVRMNSYETPDARCGEFTYAYEGGPELDKLVGNVRSMFGRDPDSFQGSYSPESFTIDGSAAGDGT